MAVQKGKQGTKGAKQIVEENASTLKFYQYMAAGATTIYFLVVFGLFEFTKLASIMGFLSVAILLAAYQFMVFMARSNVQNGVVVDSGTDLNLQGGIAEHVKDLIILTSATQVVSLLSNWFWLLLLLAPFRAIWMLWGSVIQPWMSRKDAPTDERDEKKQKKLERKMKREQKFR